MSKEVKDRLARNLICSSLSTDMQVCKLSLVLYLVPCTLEKTMPHPVAVAQVRRQVTSASNIAVCGIRWRLRESLRRGVWRRASDRLLLGLRLRPAARRRRGRRRRVVHEPALATTTGSITPQLPPHDLQNMGSCTIACFNPQSQYCTILHPKRYAVCFNPQSQYCTILHPKRYAWTLTKAFSLHNCLQVQCSVSWKFKGKRSRQRFSPRAWVWHEARSRVALHVELARRGWAIAARAGRTRAAAPAICRTSPRLETAGRRTCAQSCNSQNQLETPCKY